MEVLSPRDLGGGVDGPIEPVSHEPIRQPLPERRDLRRARGADGGSGSGPVSMPRAASPTRMPQGVGNGAICEISSSSST